MSRSVVLLGATGLVGSACARLLRADPSVGRLVLPGRRPHPRWTDDAAVHTPVIDFDRLGRHAALFAADELWICLGTTRRAAGSAEAFRRVDLEYVVEAATFAADAGTGTVLVVSSVGADADSPFLYTRTKGEMEEAVAALPFRTVVFVRPSLLLGERRERRPGEAVSAVVLRILRPLLVGPLRRYRAVSAEAVARAMAHEAVHAPPGRTVVESEEIGSRAGTV